MGDVLSLRTGKPRGPARSSRAIQLTLDFEGRRSVVALPRPSVNLAAVEGLYERACDLEEYEPPRARAIYERVIDLEPRHVEARVNLGRLLHDAGETSAAEASYRRALEIRPDATAFFNLAILLEDDGRFPEAIRSYESAILVDAGMADAHYNLAGLLERLGDPRGALRHLHAYRKLAR